MKHVTLLAISGSLRAASLNSALLRAAARIASPDVRVELYDGIGRLPLFNPDLEASDPPPVADLRRRINAVDGLLIASPEYAHGVTGVIKNALDWMVGCEAFVNKPVALLNASPRATHAQAALRETITVMSARIIDAASVAVPVLGAKLDEEGIVAHPEIAPILKAALSAFRDAIAARPREDDDRIRRDRQVDVSFAIRNLTPTDVPAYRELMEQGLRAHPDVFRISLEDAGEPLIPFAQSQPGAFTLGAFLDDDRLVGVVSFEREQRAKLRHKGLLYRMYVAADASGRGIGRQLVRAAIGQASELDGVEQINLTVVANNTRAKRLYASEGFKSFALERRGLKDDGEYRDEEQMALRINR